MSYKKVFRTCLSKSLYKSKEHPIKYVSVCSLRQRWLIFSFIGSTMSSTTEIHCTHVNFLSASWFLQTILSPCILGAALESWSGKAQKDFAFCCGNTSGCDLNEKKEIEFSWMHPNHHLHGSTCRKESKINKCQTSK